MEQYFIRLGARVSGPVTAAQLRNMAAGGKITDLHMVSTNRKDWLPAKKVQGLFVDAKKQAPVMAVPSAERDGFAYSAANVFFTHPNQSAAPPLPPSGREGMWFYEKNGQSFGPLPETSLRALAVGGTILPSDFVWPEGASASTAAADTPALAALFGNSPSATHHAASTPDTAPPRARSRPEPERFAPVEGIPDELIPIDGDKLSSLTKDKVFWAVMAMGTLPMFIMAFNNEILQLAGMLFFFAMLWGWVLSTAVLKTTASVRMPMMAFFFTGFIGLKLLLYVYRYLPSWYMQLHRSNDLAESLAGYVFRVGVAEEICKLLPAIIYLLWKKVDASPPEILLAAIFSGLGFAAFENWEYAKNAISNAVNTAVESARQGGLEGLRTGAAEGAFSAMMILILRSMSLVFGHAVWSGLAAYFLVAAIISGRQWGGRILLAILVPATLHGVYDWLCDIQFIYATLIYVLSYTLLCGGIDQLRPMLEQHDQ